MKKKADIKPDRWYRQAFELADQAILVLARNRPYIVLDVNKSFTRLFGREKAALTGKPVPFQSIINYLENGTAEHNTDPLYFTVPGSDAYEQEIVIKAECRQEKDICIFYLQKKHDESLELHSRILRQDYMIRDIHYRVKNSLQIIVSLLHMQGMVSGNREFLGLMLESETRIALISKIHELLYESDDLKNIDLRQYFRILVHLLTEAYQAEQRGIELHFDVDSVPIDIEHAIPLGLIANELITNSLKYAYPDDTGILELRAKIRGDGFLYVQIRDMGKGLPDYVDPEQPLSMGLQLVQSLSGQLEGQLLFTRKDGTDVQLKMPYSQQYH